MYIDDDEVVRGIQNDLGEILSKCVGMPVSDVLRFSIEREVSNYINSKMCLGEWPSPIWTGAFRLDKNDPFSFRIVLEPVGLTFAENDSKAYVL